MSRTKKITLWTIAIVAFLLLTYATMIYNDYNRVMNQYLKPAFAVNHDPDYRTYYDERKHWEDPMVYYGIDPFIINYGVFDGIGYYIELSGSFRPFRGIERAEGVQNYYEAILDPETGEVLNPVPEVLQARFVFFGREIATLNRAYPEDYWVPEGYTPIDIFAND